MLECIDIIELWYGEFNACNKNYHRYWCVLDEVEKVRAGNIKNTLLRNYYVETHGRLRNLLAQILNEPPEKIRINTTEHGKPYLVDNPELVFNISHSANILAITVSLNCQLGVDIECYKQRANLSALVGKCFAYEEVAYWSNLPEAQKTLEFYRFWTRKEAFVKAIGRGIALGLNRCVINPENPTEFIRVPENCGQASAWRVWDIDLGQGIFTALVADNKRANIKLIKLSI
ncbi:MAG: 4'-phosphopantetheinyl transferase family protein [Methylococcaceae bacterium]